jgi:hypothetical protein
MERISRCLYRREAREAGGGLFELAVFCSCPVVLRTGMNPVESFLVGERSAGSWPVGLPPV